MANRSNISLVGNTTTGQNLGGGAGIFCGKNTGNNLQFKSLSAGTGISMSSQANTVTICSLGGSGGITGATNLGSGNGIIYTNATSCNLNLKTLSGGTNVTLTCNGNYIGINASGTVISGTKDYISKFNSTGNNVCNSSIFDSGTTNICILKDCVIVGASGGLTTIKSPDSVSQSSSLIIKAGCNTTTGCGGNLYLSPGENVPYNGTSIYFGHPTYSKPTIWVCPAGSSTDMSIAMTAKGNGLMYVLSSCGVVIGSSYVNCALIVNGTTICSLGTNSNSICITPAINTTTTGCTLTLAGGYGGSSHCGGCLVLCAGLGSGGCVSGKIKMLGLGAKTTETCGIYIDTNGNLSTGVVGGGGSGITGATNGLGTTGQKVCLGGTLTKHTLVNTNNCSISICNPSGVGLLIESGSTASTFMGGLTYVDTDEVNGTAGMYADTGGTTNALIHVGTKGRVPTSAYAESVVFGNSLGCCSGHNLEINRFEIFSSGHTTFKGAVYDCDYSAKFTCLSIPHVGWVTGHTGGGGGITGATNGLCRYNTTNVCLGGNLTSSVTVAPTGSNNLTLGTNAGRLYVTTGGTTLCSTVYPYYNMICVTPLFTQMFSLNLATGGHFQGVSLCPSTDSLSIIAATGGGTDASICMTPSAMTIHGNYSNFHGVQYCADYSSKYTARSLVDAGYVTGRTSGVANRIAVFNASANNISATTATFIGNCLCNNTNLTIEVPDTNDIYLNATHVSGFYGCITLGKPTTSSSVTSQRISVAGAATNIDMFLTPKGSGQIYALADTVNLSNSGGAGFAFNSATRTFQLPTCAKICGYSGSAGASYCDATTMCIIGGFGANYNGGPGNCWAGCGGNIFICGGCACDGGTGVLKPGGCVVIQPGPGINGGANGNVQMCNSAGTCFNIISATPTCAQLSSFNVVAGPAIGLITTRAATGEANLTSVNATCGTSISVLPNSITVIACTSTTFRGVMYCADFSAAFQCESLASVRYVNAAVSDCKLKCNLEIISGTTLALSEINGYSFEFNEITKCCNCCNYGFIAQEVEKYFPFAVSDDSRIIDGVSYKGIDYKQLIPVLWNIVKEQDSRIKFLEDKIK